MIRVIHILDHSLPAQSGYTFRTRAILKAQQALGWHVTALTGRRHPRKGPEREVIDGIEFVRTPRIDRAPFPAPLGEADEIAALSRRLDALVREARPHILHAHSPVLDALATWPVARRHRLPWLYEIRAFWEDAAVGNGTGREGDARYRATRWLETRAVHAADAVAVICDGLRRDLVARGVAAEKILVSPNGVDMAMFGTPAAPDHALRRELGLEDADVIGFVGSFYDYEGIDLAIAAMPQIVAENPRAALLLVGGGPMETALRAQAEASPAAGRIRFVGRVPHAEVERYYALVDLTLYPRKAMRLTELVTPLKPLEAMAQGKLVAASDIGGHRELIADGDTGTLFASDDPAAIAAAIASVFARRAQWPQMRARARRFVERERNWASNIRRYEPVYERLVAQHGGSRPTGMHGGSR